MILIDLDKEWTKIVESKKGGLILLEDYNQIMPIV